MKKLTRRIALAVLLAAMLVCATVAGALLGIKGKKPNLSASTDTGIASGTHASAAGAAVPTTSDTIYDYEIHIKGTAAE
ncbi:MAG: hypothetical protein K2N74_00425 [Clostridiales bacterium]|nr:hypothetical protein [Clostridiales bacterium]